MARNNQSGTQEPVTDQSSRVPFTILLVVIAAGLLAMIAKAVGIF